MEYDKKMCPIVNVDGFIETGKQYDLDINLPEDNRDVIYGVVKDCYNEPVRDAVVKLIEIVKDCGEEEARPVSHTFTDKEGSFVFGPLCPGKEYTIQIWANRVRNYKICAEGKREGKCLKGVKMDCCNYHKPEKPCEKKEEENCCKDICKK